MQYWGETKTKKSKFHKLQSICSIAIQQCATKLHTEMNIHAPHNSLKMLYKANYHPISVAYTRIQTDINIPKKIRIRNSSTNQQQLKKYINAYCEATFLNSSVLTENQDTTSQKNYLEIFFQVLKNSNWGSLDSKTVILRCRSDTDKK